MKKQWYCTFIWNEKDPKNIANLVKLVGPFLNKYELQPGEVIILPVIENCGPHTILPIVYFREERIVWMSEGLE